MMLNLNLWIDKLPDSDDGELKRFKERIDAAIAGGASALEAAKTATDFDEAVRLADEADDIIGDGLAAAEEAQVLYEAIKAKHDAFQGKYDQAEGLVTELQTGAAECEQRGFRMDAFEQTLEQCLDDVGTAHAASVMSAVVTADGQINQLLDRLAVLREQLVELPQLPGRLSAEAERLHSLSATQRQNAVAANDVLRRMRQEYAASDCEDLLSNPGEIDELLATADESIRTGGDLADMERQDFRGADQALDEAGAALDKAKRLTAAIFTREDELQSLRGQLPSHLEEVAHEAEQVIGYIEQVRKDVDDEVLEDTQTVKEKVSDLRRTLADSPKAPLLSIRQDLTAFDTALDECQALAEQQHTEAQRLRKEIKEMRRKAKTRLGEAEQYRSYSSGRYDTASGYFSGVIHGMTLQQQLDHWTGAYNAADDAYDHGHNRYDDAHRPSYTSSSRSYDYGGGSSGHSFSIGGGGGSSGHSW